MSTVNELTDISDSSYKLASGETYLPGIIQCHTVTPCMLYRVRCYLADLGFSEFVIVFGSARLYCMPGALLCSRHRRGHQVVLRDIVHTMHNDHELLYKS